MSALSLEGLARHAWLGRTPSARALRMTLVPAAAAYRAAVGLRNHLYDRGWLAARRVPAWVVSVGNLTVGGTGKTPAALWLAERLAARGHRVGIVARGYRKRRPGPVVVGVEGRALVTPEDGGDEAVMLARRFAGPVVTGERRHEAAALACARFALDTIVLDDGFQHRALARDADLVLVADDAAADWCLPAGSLREPPGALRRARAVLAVGDAAASVPPGTVVFRGRLAPLAAVRARDGAFHAEPLDALVGRDVVAVAGIARPERLVETLGRLGARVRDVLRFPDHHAYTAADARRIAAAARAGTLVTTEKDLTKLERFPGLEALVALRVDLEVEDEAALLDLLEPAA